MRKIHINVVGTFADTDELHEIEYVARVFLVAERMIDLTEEIEIEKNEEKPIEKSPKKSISRRNLVYDRLQYLNVRGLN